MKPGNKTLEESLALLLEKSQEKSHLSIREILQALSGNGRFLALIFLSLPFCQPIQIPGVSLPFGIAIAFLGLRAAFGKRFWLPKSLLAKAVSSKTIRKIARSFLKILKKMKRLIHPRLTWVCEHRTMQVVNGLFLCVLGLFLALPLPIPFTNLVASWSIILVSLGILKRDGVCVIIGYALSLLALLTLVAILFSIF
jgi:hypothetical protein